MKYSWDKMVKLPNEIVNKHPLERNYVKKMYKNSKKSYLEAGLKEYPSMNQIKRMLQCVNEDEIWRNTLYEAHVRCMDIEGGFYHISLKNNERTTDISWQHKQWIKNDILGNEYEGVELFPAESRMVNTANQYHLWCAPKGIFGMGWHGKRLVSSNNPIENGKQTLIKKETLK